MKRTTYTRYQKLLQCVHRNNIREISELVRIIDIVSMMAEPNQEVSTRLLGFSWDRISHCLDTIKKSEEEFKEETKRANKEFESKEANKKFESKEAENISTLDSTSYRKEKNYIIVSKEDDITYVDENTVWINGEYFHIRNNKVQVLSSRGEEDIKLLVATRLLKEDKDTNSLVLFGKKGSFTIEPVCQLDEFTFQPSRSQIYFINQFTLSVDGKHFVSAELNCDEYEIYKKIIRKAIKEKIKNKKEFKLIGDFK